ncbi:MAG: YetF domain-containing protein, partial [Desulfocucumaceae bacterium]
IMDGEIFEERLQRAGRSRSWLSSRLGEVGLKPEEVFLAIMERDETILIDGTIVIDGKSVKGKRILKDRVRLIDGFTLKEVNSLRHKKFYKQNNEQKKH